MNTNKPLIIYHANCSDGAGAAFAAWKKFGMKAEYRAAKHEVEKPPTDDEIRGRQVFVLDFSYPMDDMCRMGKVCELLIIDHHKSFQESLERRKVARPTETNLPFKYIFDKDHSGAVLAWKYFHKKKSVPELLLYIEDRDLWHWKMRCSKEIAAALEARYVRTNFMILNRLVEDWNDYRGEGTEDAYSMLISDGRAILSAQNQYVDVIVSNAEKIKFYTSQTDYYEVYAANSPILQSEVGHVLANNAVERNKTNKHNELTFGAVWYHDGVNHVYHVSLRSVGDDFDCANLAKQFGGGGHKHAASFRCKTLPWQ